MIKVVAFILDIVWFRGIGLLIATMIELLNNNTHKH
jgi:hypothetical protein